MNDVPVWRNADDIPHCYVPRCSACGAFKGSLMIHWFFTGLYCRDCIEENLYGGYRNAEEVKR